MINGSVRSGDIDYFYYEIIGRLRILGEINIYSLVADLMANPIVPFVHYSDYIYLYLINRIIDSNFIKRKIKNGK